MQGSRERCILVGAELSKWHCAVTALSVGLRGCGHPVWALSPEQCCYAISRQLCIITSRPTRIKGLSCNLGCRGVWWECRYLRISYLSFSSTGEPLNTRSWFWWSWLPHFPLLLCLRCFLSFLCCIPVLSLKCSIKSMIIYLLFWFFFCGGGKCLMLLVSHNKPSSH